MRGGRLATAVAGGVLLGALAGCGAAPLQSPASGSPSPAPQQPLVAIIVSAPAPSSSASPGSTVAGQVELVDLSGHVVAKGPGLPEGYAPLLGVNHMLLIADTDGQQMRALGRDGHVQNLGAVGSDVEGLVASPDGSQWAWSEANFSGSSSSSTLYVGGVSSGGHQIATLGASENRTYNPVGWGPQGIFVQSSPVGIGCAGVAFGTDCFAFPVYLLDPSTGKLGTQLLKAGQCGISEVNAAGDYLCVVWGPDGATNSVRRVSHDGASKTFRVPAADVVGDMHFLPDGSGAIVGGAKAISTGDSSLPTYSYQAFRLDFSTGQTTPFGPSGFDPEAVLPDGRVAGANVGNGPSTTTATDILVVSADGRTSTLLGTAANSTIAVVP